MDPGLDEPIHRAVVSRPVPNGYVYVVPELEGGWAGWSMEAGYRTKTEGGSGGAPLGRTSTGPIFAEQGCEQNERSIDVFALTTHEVAAVSVAGGRPIATTTNSTLPDGLRAAAVEVLRRNGQPSILRNCPRITPFDVHGKPIDRKGKPGSPQAFKLRGTRQWEAPAHPPRGVCELAAAQLPQEIVASKGGVATQVRPHRGLFGQALLSCVGTVYVYEEQHHLTAAVLLDAERPGARPPALAGMKPVPGRRGIFESPGAEGKRVERRIPGAWLVVEEEDEIGLRVPVELLESLYATVPADAGQDVPRRRASRLGLHARTIPKQNRNHVRSIF